MLPPGVVARCAVVLLPVVLAVLSVLPILSEKVMSAVFVAMLVALVAVILSPSRCRPANDREAGCGGEGEGKGPVAGSGAGAAERSNKSLGFGERECGERSGGS